jgi:hypothetical protein
LVFVRLERQNNPRDVCMGAYSHQPLTYAATGVADLANFL